MDTERLKILILEDNEMDAEMIQHLLTKSGLNCRFKVMMTREDYITALDEFKPHIILSDNAMPQFSASEALGQHLDLVIPEHLRKAHWRGFDAAMENGKTRLGGRPTMTRGLHKTGQKLYVEMSFALVTDVTGSALGSVAVARDVTERVERDKAAVAAHPR